MSGTQKATSAAGRLAGIPAISGSKLGAFTKQSGDTALSTGGGFAGYDLGNADGSLADRAGKVDAQTAATAALLFGPVGGAVIGGLKAAGSGVKRGASRVAKRMRRSQTAEASARAPNDAPRPTEPQKPKPRAMPKEPGDESLRSTIESAFKKRSRRY